MQIFYVNAVSVTAGNIVDAALRCLRTLGVGLEWERGENHPHGPPGASHRLRLTDTEWRDRVWLYTNNDYLGLQQRLSVPRKVAGALIEWQSKQSAGGPPSQNLFEIRVRNIDEGTLLGQLTDYFSKWDLMTTTWAISETAPNDDA